jgi:hypothetical protein
MSKFNFDEFMKPYDKYAPEGDSRRSFYKYATNFLVELNRPIVIVETGTMHGSQGAFTLIFADLIKNWTGGRLITIDISEDHLNLSKQNTKEYSSVIEYILSDSVKYLESISHVSNKIDLLYLDSFDLDVTDPLPSEIHHLRELTAVYSNLSNNVLIGVDDNLMPGNWIEWKQNGRIEIYHATDKIIGKGTLVDRFLRDNGWSRFNDDKSYCLLGYKRS